MADPTKLAPVPERQTLVGDEGKTTREWISWLNELKARAEQSVQSGGGAGTIDASQIVSGTIALARISGLTDAQIASAAAIAWSKINKAGSSLADLTTRDASAISSGLLALARGGTAADLSGTGGTAQVLKQLSAGAAVTVATLLAAEMPSGIDAAKIADGSISNTEFQYLDGAIENIQGQLNRKLYRPDVQGLAWVNFWGTGASLTPSVVGLRGISVSGASSDGNTADDPFTVYSTSSLNVSIGARSTQGLDVRATMDPEFFCRFKTGPDISDIRIYIGLANGQVITDNGSTQHYACVRYSTSAGDAGWIGACSDGASANQQLTSMIAAIAADTEYEIGITISGNGTLITFNINGSTATLATHIPTVEIGPLVNAHNLLAEAKQIAISRIAMLWSLDSGSGPSSFTFPSHNLLSGTHPDTTAAAPVNGDLIVAQSGKWARFAVGATDTVARVVAGLPSWSKIVDAMVDAAAAIAWSKISKTGSSLADLATRSASDLSSGTLADARLSSKVPLDDVAEAISGVWDFSNGLKEHGRTAKLGEWTAVAYAGGNFTGSGTITWTVDSGDQTSFSYTIIGKTVVLNLRIEGTSVSGTGNVLSIALPAGIAPLLSVAGPALVFDNGGNAAGFFTMGAGVASIGFLRGDTGNFAAATNSTSVYVVVTYEIA